MELVGNRIKVLHVVNSLDFGGLENIAVNFIRYLNKEKYQIDYLVVFPGTGGYEDEVKALGGNVWRLDASINQPISFGIRFLQFLKENPYDVVHSHILFRSAYILALAKLKKINIRVAHSHTTKIDVKIGIAKKIYEFFMRKLLNRVVSERVACGNEAALFLFGENYANRVNILKNGVDVSLYHFDKDKRIKERQKWKVENDLLIISVARLFPVKNHEFMFKIIKYMLQNGIKTQLFLVGDGYIREKLENIVKENKLEKNIRFLGFRSDVADLLQASDVFLMPSLFEGVPLSLIEAQASGIPSVISSTITREVDITGTIRFLDLNDNIQTWVTSILEASKSDRKDNSRMIVSAGYDISEGIKQFENIYGVKRK